MNFESLLECQERGAKARILGSPITENPYDCPAGRGLDEDTRAQLQDAWTYGWTIEDAMRQNDTGIYAFLRAETALAAGNNTHS
ncbi:hypothetical protein [Rhizobium sp. FY34]|uniref:hypothetical protein n=1 Tax=Rhizobium sp. FY34 TaxID=2562309 RepID=UPI0010BFDC06|nr:hypothetical protein [Rhizobium sp. FY34]